MKLYLLFEQFGYLLGKENCDDQNQSPVDIVLSSLKEDDMGALTFTKYDCTTGYTMTLKNNGHTGK